METDQSLEERGRTRPHGDLKAIVVLSGGQDSTTCLFWALDAGAKVHAVTFDYGQRHNREIHAAEVVYAMAQAHYGLQRVLDHEIIRMGPILKGTSPLVSDSKLEQYESHAVLPGGLEKTFVPMRNQLFLTIAANRAYIHECEAVITGVCEEDYGGYPDCRHAFIHALNHACNLGAFTGKDGAPRSLAIMTPLMSLTKKATVELALKLPGCYQALAFTHTSYDGAYPPIGHDHATLLRAKGFEQAGVPDPLVLRAVAEGLMACPEAPNYTNEKRDTYARILGLP